MSSKNLFGRISVNQTMEFTVKYTRRFLEAQLGSVTAEHRSAFLGQL